MDEQSKEHSKRDRSPSFPYIGLEKALERIQTLYEKARRNEVRVADVAKDWGLAAKSSSTDRNVAALLAYGLIEDSGSGENRKIKLSDSGSRILDDKRPGVRERLLADAALKPKIISEYHTAHWKDGRPDDSHAISALKFDGGFTDEGARMFLRVFDETITFAGIGTSSGGSDSDADNTHDSEDLKTHAHSEAEPKKQSADYFSDFWKPGSSASGRREEKFALREGDVQIVYPSDLSIDSVDDLEAYIQVFLKKIRRDAAQAAKGGGAS